MNKAEFLVEIDNILELDEGTLKGPETLSEIDEWDSLAFLSVIAMADEHFNIVIEGEQLEQVNTVDDLVSLVDEHLAA